VEDFERNFAEASGAPACVGVNNGTTALKLAARALHIGPGDEVIVPAFTFIGSAWTACHVGARPVFADIVADTFTLDPEKLGAFITERTKAIVVVHLFGQPADMDPILDIAEKNRIPLIEDCAQSHLATYRGRPAGMMGDAGTFSFYPTKNLGGCGEGGAVISRRSEIVDRVRLLRVHGMGERYRHDEIGYNNRMEGFQAAALNVKLKHLREWTADRRRVAARYRAGITNPGVTLPANPEYAESVYHQFTIRHANRDALRTHLAGRGIATDTIYPIPLHLQPCFNDLGYDAGDFPVAEQACRTVLSLPIFPELTDVEIDYVIESINAFGG
jgi:dTDP-4-amino-4,6-dideoxygalactose transaminase